MWAALHSETKRREIAAGDAHGSWHTFKVAVPASPQKIDEQWSDWIVRVAATDNKQRQSTRMSRSLSSPFAADRPDLVFIAIEGSINKFAIALSFDEGRPPSAGA